MENSSPLVRRRGPKPSEEGYLLLAVMFLLAVLVLSLAAAAPNMARSIQRDRDVETMERGKQYERAIQLYYRRFHAYPPNIDALVKTNDIRFLRKRYTDPITGKDDWKPILFGQNKAPIAMGFFGQPLGMGSSLAGVGPSGGNGLNGVNGSNPSSGGLFNSSGGSGFGSSPGGIFGSSTPTSPPNAPVGSSGTSTASPTDGNSSTPGSGSNSTSSSNSFGNNLSGQTFGGAGIIGFEPASTKQSILIFKKKDHYNEWEFTYDPIMERMMMAGGNTGMIGQPASGMPGMTSPGSGIMGTPGTSPTSGFSGNGPTASPVTPPETPVPEQ